MKTKITIPGADGRRWTWEVWQTWVISHAVRNALEMFHGGGAMDPENPAAVRGFITDAQMNIVIRRTVYTTIHMMANMDEVHPDARTLTGWDVTGWLMNIPEYMEPPGSPELEEAYRHIRDGRWREQERSR